MGFLIGCGVSVSLSGFVAWLFWGPIRGFLFSIIPTTAESAWVGKLFVVVLVAYLGGVGLPLFILVAGIVLAAKISS